MRRLYRALSLVFMVLVAGCTSTGPAALPDATETFHKVAEALAAVDGTRVPVSGKPTDVDYELKLVTEGMGTTPQVRVSDAPRYDAAAKTATATLDVTWPLTQPWQYQTTATLAFADGAWKWQWNPQTVYPKLSEASKLELSIIPANRGRILGAGGVAIMEPHTVYDVGIDKANTPPDQLEASARALAQLVGVDEAGFLTKVHAAGAQAFVVAVTVRDLPPNGLDAIKGGLAQKNVMHLPPTKGFANNIFGSVGAATKEQAEKSQGAIKVGEQIGQSGLEQQHDATLRGKDGYRVDLVKRDQNYAPTAQPGSSVEILPAMAIKVDAIHGADLKTTLDKELQLRLEQQLVSSAPTSIVIVQPSTGKILAMASGPTGQTQTSPNLDRNAPGSTFKIVSSLALFRKGLTPESIVNCSKGAMVNGQKIENYPGYPDSRTGNLTLRDAFWESCNTAFINSRDIFGHEGLVDAAASLGFGVDYETGFPADYGHVPDVKNENEYAPQTFGQGTDQANALSLTGIAASVAAGHTVIPYLVEGTKIDIKAAPLTSQEVTYLRDIMSNYTKHFNNEGEIISGCKTGTAEYTKPDGTAAAHGWLTSYNLPKDVAITVFQYDTEGQNSTFAQTKKALS